MPRAMNEEDKRVQMGCRMNPKWLRILEGLQGEYHKGQGETLDALVCYFTEMEAIRESIDLAIENDDDAGYEEQVSMMWRWLEGGLYCVYAPEDVDREMLRKVENLTQGVK